VVLHAGHEEAEQLFALPQPLLGVATRGEVARHSAEAAQLAACIAQRRGDRAGPEARAVLAHAPAFIRQATFAPGDLELALRRARREVVRLIEHRKVLADGFARLVAHDARRAGVPRADLALGAEEEDGVVLHRVD